MENFIDFNTADILAKLCMALVLGLIIGMERVWAHKTAGMRTYALVAMGSALLVVISEEIVSRYSGLPGLSPTLLVSQIIVGVGFIGTGLIFTRDNKLMGLTTATGLWVSAGIGMASGYGLFKIALIATFFTLFIFVIIWFVEEQIKKMPIMKKEDTIDNS